MYNTQCKLTTRLASFPGLPPFSFWLLTVYAKTVGSPGKLSEWGYTWATTKLKDAFRLKRISLQTKTGSVTSYVVGTKRRQAYKLICSTDPAP